MVQTGKSVESFETIQGRLERQLEEQSLLLDITQRLASSFDLTETMPFVAQGALQATQAQLARVVLCDELTQSQAMFVFPAGKSDGKLQILDQHIVTLVRKLGQFSTRDIKQDARQDVAFAPLTETLTAVAAWPLQVQEQLLGVLWVGFTSAYTIQQGQQPFLSTLAWQTAIAIANARSYLHAQSGRRRLEAVLGGTTDPILVVNGSGRLSLINEATSSLLQVDDDVLGQPVQQALADFPTLLRFFGEEDALNEGEEWISPDGKTYSPRLSRITNTSPEVGSLVLILRDITHFKQLHKNQVEFVRLVSHDLRSPLTYMKGFASLIGLTGEINERQEEFVQKILNGISQMAELVDNIQDAGRWDPQTGFYDMSREPSDIAAIVHDLVSQHQTVATRQQVTVKADIAPDVPIVNIDSLMIERALNNLVNNAIKYSPDGGTVTVTVTVEDEQIIICVADTGLGIAPDHLPLLFQRGARIVTPAIKENKIKGSGLGLFIVRSVARRHGGDAWVESTLGEGSRFYMSIPLSGANLIGSRAE